MICPGPFGSIAAGADKNYPLDCSHLNLQGCACGAKGLPKGVVVGPDTATFPSMNTETEYGWTKKVKMKVPTQVGSGRQVHRRRDPRRGSGVLSAPS